MSLLSSKLRWTGDAELPHQVIKDIKTPNSKPKANSKSQLALLSGAARITIRAQARVPRSRTTSYCGAISAGNSCMQAGSTCPFICSLIAVKRLSEQFRNSCACQRRKRVPQS